MEKDILDELYYGHIIPWDNRNDKTPEMIPVSDAVEQDIESLQAVLDQDGKAVLERLLDNAAELERQMICEGFKDGFRLGAKLMLAVTEGEKEP